MNNDADRLREALLSKAELSVQTKANDAEVKILLERLQPGVHQTNTPGEVVVIRREGSYYCSDITWLVGKVEKLR